jgi:ubiquinone/menaquinone biosynthesis C-methylase UbiE
MNSGLPNDHVSIRYYDSDYPSPLTSIFPENFDETTKDQGLAFDLARFCEIAREQGGPILDLCCGTGRVTTALARDGHDVVGVDVSAGMLDGARANLAREKPEVASRIVYVQQDVTCLDLGTARFRLAVCGFNSLLCIVDFRQQISALAAAARHLAPGGLLVLDLVNPLRLKLQGDDTPRPFFTRRNPVTGRNYTRFAMAGAFDSDHRQRLYGWYDEIDDDGTVQRRTYSVHWRPIFRHELELMIERASLIWDHVEGGHCKEPYTAQSPKMLAFARTPTA